MTNAAAAAAAIQRVAGPHAQRRRLLAMARERDEAAGPAVLLEPLEDARLLAGEAIGGERRIGFVNGRVGHFVQQRHQISPARFTRRATRRGSGPPPRHSSISWSSDR